jgi:hypothetical protein
VETPRDPWKIDVVDRHCAFVDLLIGLSTGSLVLPTLFLRTFLAVPENKPLLPYLSFSAYAGISAFSLSILFGLAYRYASTKWIKDAWGQPVSLASGTIESILNWTFWLMVVAFVIGLGAFLTFAATSHAG